MLKLPFDDVVVVVLPLATVVPVQLLPVQLDWLVIVWQPTLPVQVAVVVEVLTTTPLALRLLRTESETTDWAWAIEPSAMERTNAKTKFFMEISFVRRA